ncbi:hypothetical protein GOP47_0015532 [Adiantum capillus-veneris]|uniref:Uncharacterized protein n=1 Tax=Adiantum capillus-veneris TaxID=13818 RepID=A0A9D4UJW1_ADICA|nr:hypothetical protein GOP47_0015532 [Adiantum capillus-veneris]
MESFCPADRHGEGVSFDRMVSEGVQMCPFLRNIGVSTNFSFSSLSRFPAPVRGNHGPIFEDGPNFDLAFKLFHGQNGVVPLSQHSQLGGKNVEEQASSIKFHPLAASAAAISLSALGASGPFGFDAFMSKRLQAKKNNKPQKKEKQYEEEKKRPASSEHEAWSNDWLQTGNCPIAKSFRAVSGVLPLVAKVLQPPPGLKVRCPPAIVAARAALARTAAVKALKPQPLPSRVLAVGLLGMALNVPLGIWREHTEKFSPAWFTAVHASVPFIAMLRKAVHMPKYVMAYTFAASILGQVIGSRAERRRIELAKLKSVKGIEVHSSAGESGLHSGAADCEARLEKIPMENMDSSFPSLCGKDTWNFPEKAGSTLSAIQVV